MSAGALTAYPSLAELGRRFGVSQNTIKRAMAAKGVDTRPPGERLRIEIAAGRRTLPNNPRRGEHSPFARGLARGPTQRAGEHQEKLNQERRLRAAACWEERPCRWCGQLVRRTLADLKVQPRPACCRSHASQHRA